MNLLVYWPLLLKLNGYVQMKDGGWDLMIFKIFLIEQKVQVAVIYLFLSVFMICAEVLLASSPFEPEPKKVELHYHSGERVTLSCEEDGCTLNVLISSEEIFLDKDQLAAVGAIIPSMVKLYSRNIPMDSFVVETEIECSEYAEDPPFFSCYAMILVEDGEILSVDRKKVFAGREVGNQEETENEKD